MIYYENEFCLLFVATTGGNVKIFDIKVLIKDYECSRTLFIRLNHDNIIINTVFTNILAML